MIKIKDIGNDQLKKYLEAYKELATFDPSNEDYQFKIQAIEKALNNRALLGINVKDKNNTSSISKLLGKFKKNK